MKYFSLLIGFFMAGSLVACDICGGGIQMEGANSAIPFYMQNQLSLRYSKVDLKHPGTSFNGSSRVFADHLSRIKLQGRFYPSERWQLLGFLPFAMNRRDEELRTSRVNQIGDLSVHLNRFVLNTNDSINRDTRILWLTGLGITLPTGKYQQRDETKVILPIGLQAGQGAYQFSVSSQFTVRHKKWGLGNYSTFNIPQTNELNYQLGRSITSATLFFHVLSKNKSSLIPQAGLLILAKQKDKRYGEWVDNTSLTLGQCQLGLDYYYKNYLLQTGAFIPIAQKTTNTQPRQSATITMGVSCFISQ